MESQELIAVVRKELDQVEAQGGTRIQISTFKTYLAALEKHAETSQQHRKREHEGILARYQAKNQQSIEMLKAVLETGKSALHAVLIINGGAVIALLGVLSNLVGKTGGDVLAKHLALPLLEFGVGVLCGALGFAFRYFSQDCYAISEKEKDKFEVWGNRLKYVAIFWGTSGFVLFGLAIINAYCAVSRSFPP